MGTITNKTHRPLSVPLPDGKTLRLGALATAEISAKATQHPPLRKLVDAGTVELQANSTKDAHGSQFGGGAPRAARGAGGGPGIRKTGDR